MRFDMQGLNSRPLRWAWGTLACISTWTLAQAPDVKTSREVFQSWSVDCVEKAEVKRCVANHVVKADSGQVVAMLSASPLKSGGRIEFALPLGLDLQRALEVKVDSLPAKTIAYRTCNARACFAIVDDQTLFQSFSGGGKAVLTVQTIEGNAVNMEVPLQGFSAAMANLKK